MTQPVSISVSKVQAAFTIGWTLYRAVLRLPPEEGESAPTPDLPAISEMGTAGWLAFQFEYLSVPLTTMGLAGDPRFSLADISAALRATDGTARTKIGALYGTLLAQLTKSDAGQASALVLGRWLAGTCYGPGPITKAFGRPELSKLQSVLKDVADQLPADVAVTVSMSLDRWAAWISVYKPAPGPAVVSALQAQGEHWRALLAGEKSPRSLLTPEANAGAVEATAQRTANIVWRTVCQFAAPLAIVLGIGAGLVVLSILEAAGTAKVWSSLVSVAAALGVTGATVKRGASSIADSAAGAIDRMHDVDAMVYVATWLPEAKGTWRQHHQMRQRGVPPARPY